MGLGKNIRQLARPTLRCSALSGWTPTQPGRTINRDWTTTNCSDEREYLPSFSSRLRSGKTQRFNLYTLRAVQLALLFIYHIGPADTHFMFWCHLFCHAWLVCCHLHLCQTGKSLQFNI
jgi:hypothetical protein